MFSTKCDLCGTTQTEEDASKLTGTAIAMNGSTRHACGTCMTILNTAFAIGKEGMSDPMKALAKMTSERDHLTRRLELVDHARSGQVLSMQEVFGGQKRFNLMNPQESGAPRLGGPATVPTPEPTPAAPKTMLGRFLGHKKSSKKDDKKR